MSSVFRQAPSRGQAGPPRGALRDRWSDATGFGFFAGLAVWTLSRMPEVGIFLLPTLAHELFVAVAFLMRDRAKAAHPTLAARAAAYGGTFLIIGFFHAGRSWRPEWLTQNSSLGLSGIGALLWLAGSLLVVLSLWSLRYAFSIEPEARRVVRNGAYRFVRHPIYLGYVLQYGGVWLIYPSPALTMTLLAWFVVTLARIHFEEQVLVRAFPEYRAYKETIGALVPLQVLKRIGAA